MKIRYFIILALSLLLYSIFLTGISRVAFENKKRSDKLFGKTVTSLVYESSEVLKTVKKYFSKKKAHYIENDSTKNGFSYYTDSLESYPKLLVSYKLEKECNLIELYDINSGEIIKTWMPNLEKLRKGCSENPKFMGENIGLSVIHPLMTKDSSIIMGVNNVLVKIDSNSEIVWVNKEIEFHHSIEFDDEGMLYICGKTFKSKHFDFLPKPGKYYDEILNDDNITRIDASNGKVIFTKSVISILIENGFQDLLYKNGRIFDDMIHLNDVQPAYDHGEFWNKGDLLVSCRHLSAIFLYRPSENKIIWLKQGPWLNQHDVDFHGKNEVVVFGNDVLLDVNWNTSRGVLPQKCALLNHHNQVYVYNLENNDITTPYHKMLEESKVQTYTEGRSEILSNGDLFVEETNNGRILFGDSTDKKIEFVRRIDEKHTTYLHWSRIIY